MFASLTGKAEKRRIEDNKVIMSTVCPLRITVQPHIADRFSDMGANNHGKAKYLPDRIKEGWSIYPRMIHEKNRVLLFCRGNPSHLSRAKSRMWTGIFPTASQFERYKLNKTNLYFRSPTFASAKCVVQCKIVRDREKKGIRRRLSLWAMRFSLF